MAWLKGLVMVSSTRRLGDLLQVRKLGLGMEDRSCYPVGPWAGGHLAVPLQGNSPG